MPKKWRDRKNLKQRGYELPGETATAIDDLASELGLPKSQVVTMLVHVGIDKIKDGSFPISNYLKSSRSPLYRYTLDMDKFLEDWG